MLKVGVAGVGRWGRNVLRNLVRHPGADVVAVFDPSPAGKEQAATIAPEAALVESFDALLSAGVEAVAVCAAAETHYELAKAALRHGLPTFVEKPLALTVPQGEELAALAAERNLPLLVGHVLRYHPALAAVLSAIESGEIGSVMHLHCTRTNFGRVRAVENVLWSLAPHDILNAVLVFGEWPERVACLAGERVRPGIADFAQLNLSFPSGREAFIHLSWLDPLKRRELTVIGEQGMLHWNDTAGTVELHPNRAEPLTAADGSAHTEHHSYATRQLAIPDGEPLYREMDHFLACCEGRETPLGSGVEGLKILKILAAADQSATAKGIPITL